MISTRAKIKRLLCLSSTPTDKSETTAQSNTTSRNGDVATNGNGDVSHKPREPLAAPRQSVSAATSSTNSDDSKSDKSESEESVLKELRAFNIKNLKTLGDVALSGVSGEPIDDRTYLMERIIQLAAELPVESRSSETLTKAFLSQLWHDLQHPPKSYLGYGFAFRKADGSNNNILWPQIGAAGQPYARSVKPKKMQPISLPDPGLIFDSVLARKQFTPHPTKISSVLFYVATVIIHDIFHTSHQDFNISETSSYLDLAPLYGSSEEQQLQVRTRRDGKLKPDCFADPRPLGFPPGVGTLLIMFNRFHNHVVEDLAKIDESGRFSRILNPPGRPPLANAQAMYDEALFQTGRLITTGLYINIILKDYVRTILNLNRVDSHWNLDPRAEQGKIIFPENVPEAMGNQVSAEFNLVYRWHSCISERDEEWTKQEYEKIVGNNYDLSITGFLQALQKWAVDLPADPHQRPFADLQRNSDGYYSDDDLASIWTSSVEDVAGKFGANNVPPVLKNVEVLGIIQSRSWNLASLNEFRDYFKLQPHQTFEDINPDPHVASQLRDLYGHPDNVEIYPGLICEADKIPKKPGSGLCTNFTISRAILSDAVALVRSDRFYTVDYTPKNLTNYGFKAASYDQSIDYGCVFYKLVLNAFPNNYTSNSIYAHYPLVIPSENINILKGLKQEMSYDFETPTYSKAPQVISSAQSVRSVLANDSNFTTVWTPNMISLRGYAVVTNVHLGSIAQNLLDQRGLIDTVKQFYSGLISQSMQTKPCQVGNIIQVDILHDVLNPAHLELVKVIMPFITGEDERKLRDTYHNFDVNQLLESAFSSSHSPKQYHQQDHVFGKCIKNFAEMIGRNINQIMKHGLSLEATTDKGISAEEQLKNYRKHAVEKALRNDLSGENLAWTQAIPLMAGMFVIMSRLSAQCIDYFFGRGNNLLPEIQRLAQLNSTDSSADLEKYVSIALSSSSFISIARMAQNDVRLQDGDRSLNLTSGQTVICQLRGLLLAAGQHETAHELDSDMTAHLSEDLSHELDLIYKTAKIAIIATLRCFGRMKQLSRSPGAQGHLRKITDQYGSVVYLNKEESLYSAYPSSMKICWTP